MQCGYTYGAKKVASRRNYSLSNKISNIYENCQGMLKLKIYA